MGDQDQHIVARPPGYQLSPPSDLFIYLFNHIYKPLQSQRVLRGLQHKIYTKHIQVFKSTQIKSLQIN